MTVQAERADEEAQDDEPEEEADDVCDSISSSADVLDAKTH